MWAPDERRRVAQLVGLRAVQRLTLGAPGIVAMEAQVSELVIVGGRVWDGTGAEPRAGTVVVRDGRIAEIQAPGATLPAEATRIDADGGLVMPGLIDCHVHLTSSGAANYELQRLKDTT